MFFVNLQVWPGGMLKTGDALVTNKVSWYFREYLAPLVDKGKFEYMGSLNTHYHESKTPPQPDEDVMIWFYRKYGKDMTMKFFKYVRCKKNAEAAYKSYASYATDQPEFSDDDMSWGFQILDHFWGSLCSDCHIVGNETVFDEIKGKSSAGEPFVTQYNLATKADVLMNLPHLINLDYAYCYPTLTKCIVKAELKSLTKVENNDLRTVYACSIEHYMEGVRLFSDFNHKFQDSALLTPSCLGRMASVFHGNYDKMANALGFEDVKDFTLQNLFAIFDAKGWDKRFFRKLFILILMFRLKCFCPKCFAEALLRCFMFYKDIFDGTVLMPYGELVRKTGIGQSSGNYNTSYDNTMGVVVVFYTVVHRSIQPEWPLKLVVKFFHVIANGDDHLPCLHPIVVVTTRIQQFVDGYKKLNIPLKYDSLQWVSLDQCKFLSRTFLRVNNKWTAYPETEKQMCSLLYNVVHRTFYDTLIRASSLRRESYYNKDCFELLDSFCYDMVHSTSFETLSIHQKREVVASLQSRRQLERLFWDFD